MKSAENVKQEALQIVRDYHYLTWQEFERKYPLYSKRKETLTGAYYSILVGGGDGR